MAGAAPVVAARHITKRFAGSCALDDVHLTVAAGEVHGLVGENGSGKSTLVKVLAGYHAPGPGAELDVHGSAIRLPLRPDRAARLGLSFVHQDLGLIPSLSVAENLLLGELAVSGRRIISWRRERSRARETLTRFGVDADPSAKLAGLPPVQRAQVAIVRAVQWQRDRSQKQGGLIVLDEPTAYLSGQDRRRVHEMLRAIAGAGAGVLLVTHDLSEARATADRITVLRDGRNAGALPAADATSERLTTLIVGRAVAPDPASAPAVRAARSTGGTIVVSGLSGAVARDVCFELDEGEILGLAGPPGSGFEEVPYLLYGARPCRAGRLTLEHSYDLATMTPAQALDAGIALLAGERRRGAVASLSVGANLTLPVLDRYSARHRLEHRRMRRDTAALLARHGVKPADPRAGFATLSGGNQQKALLAKAIATGPRLLLLDEPTRGVDVGARRGILSAIRSLVQDGVCVVCASADHVQLAELCDRVLVFSGGAVAERRDTR